MLKRANNDLACIFPNSLRGISLEAEEGGRVGSSMKQNFCFYDAWQGETGEPLTPLITENQWTATGDE